jgi:general secretion pathway protein C
MIQRLFWLAYLVLITLAAALGADMTVSYLASRLSQATVHEEGPSDRTPQDAVRRPASAYDVIAQRNIFHANPPSETPSPAPTPPKIPKPEVVQETPLQLKLTGTATGGSGINYAFIEDTAKRGYQQLYQVGDVIQNRTIVEIRDDCVILEQKNGEYEQLCFPHRQDSAAMTPERRGVSSAALDNNSESENSNEDVVQIDEGTWQIRRELMQEQFANLGSLSQQARVTPYIVQGETRGFRVTRLKANSLLQKIGLQPGDVLQKVNGSSITSPTEALQAYQQLQQAGTVRLEILRRDRASTLTYEIR